MTGKRMAIRGVYAALLIGVALVGAQLYMTVAAADSARETARQEWAATNPDSAEVVAEYRERCVKGNLEMNGGKPSAPPMTFAKCAQQFSDTLAEGIQAASDSIVAPAPLRWF